LRKLLAEGTSGASRKPAQTGPRPQLGVDLDQLMQPRALVDRQRVQKPVFHAALGQTLHTADETLQRGDARRDDLLGPQALDAGLDQWQRSIVFQRQRHQLLAKGVRLWPAAVLETKLAAQLVEVLGRQQTAQRQAGWSRLQMAYLTVGDEEAWRLMREVPE
jgi:hypothetical protein